MDIGLIEGEITEHSLRKVVDCLVTDLISSRASTSKTTAEDKDASRFFADDTIDINDKSAIEIVEDANMIAKKRESFKLTASFEGINYKMRLRKEESVLKIIDIAFNFGRETNEPNNAKIDLHVSVTDLQILHQNNELIFKHSFGSDLIAEDDKSIFQTNQLKIWSLKLEKQDDLQKIETKLNNLLIIFESKACLQILQNVNTIRNIMSKAIS